MIIFLPTWGNINLIVSISSQKIADVSNFVWIASNELLLSFHTRGHEWDPIYMWKYVLHPHDFNLTYGKFIIVEDLEQTLNKKNLSTKAIIQKIKF